jgi:hypothetical protein
VHQVHCHVGGGAHMGHTHLTQDRHRSASVPSAQILRVIETPNINRIAEDGLVYTNFHTTQEWELFDTRLDPSVGGRR